MLHVLKSQVLNKVFIVVKVVTYGAGYMKDRVCFYGFHDIPSDKDLHILLGCK